MLIRKMANYFPLLLLLIHMYLKHVHTFENILLKTHSVKKSKGSVPPRAPHTVGHHNNNKRIYHTKSSSEFSPDNSASYEHDDYYPYFKLMRSGENLMEHSFGRKKDPYHKHKNFQSSDDNELQSLESAMEYRKEKLRCAKCKNDRRGALLTEEELTRLRIEFVKHQILEKLRLKERPNVSAVELPQPISEGVTIEDEHKMTHREYDDYYARTSKKFIFLELEKHECSKLHAKPRICFSFKIDDSDADSFDVNTAVLWLYKSSQHKNRSETLLQQDTIVVSEVQQQLRSNFLPLVKIIAIQSINMEDEWLKIDIEWPIKRWFGNHDLSHLIQVTCQSCDIPSMTHLISIEKNYRPFIMVDTKNRRRALRQKRSINCTNGITACCREKLYISFDDIGWGDWIIHPRGYDAHFCRGSCNSLASITMSMSQHSSTVQKLLSHPGHRRKNLELVPCCTAKQYSSLQLMFMDSNNTATQKTFPNMVVESCGCR